MSENSGINENYPFQVWLTSIIISPFLILSYFVFLSLHAFDFDISYLMFPIIGITFGGVLSLPTLLVYYLSFKKLKTKSLNVYVLKSLFTLICIAGVILSFYLLELTNLPSLLKLDYIPFPVAYITTIIISTFLFKIKLK